MAGTKKKSGVVDSWTGNGRGIISNGPLTPVQKKAVDEINAANGKKKPAKKPTKKK